jgi:hypothetical protein
VTDAERSSRWKAVAGLLRRLPGQQARSNLEHSSNAVQEFRPERSSSPKSPSDAAGVAEPEAGGTAPQSKCLLASEAAARR